MYEVEQLNERAVALGLEVRSEDPPVLPLDAAGDPYRLCLGTGEWCRIYRKRKPVFKFAWRAEEVHRWLRLMERLASQTTLV